MRAGFIVTGVLGIGTALVFGAAALVSLAVRIGKTRLIDNVVLGGT